MKSSSWQSKVLSHFRFLDFLKAYCENKAFGFLFWTKAQFELSTKTRIDLSQVLMANLPVCSKLYSSTISSSTPILRYLSGAAWNFETKDETSWNFSWIAQYFVEIILSKGRNRLILCFARYFIKNI